MVWAPWDNLEGSSRREGKCFFDIPSVSYTGCYIINKISVPGTGNGLEPREEASFSSGDCAVIVSAGQGGMAFRRLGMEVWKAANLYFCSMATAALAQPPSFHFSAFATRAWSPKRPVLSSTLLMPFVPGWDSQSDCLICSQMHTHKPNCPNVQVRTRIASSIAETAVPEATCPQLNL